MQKAKAILRNFIAVILFAYMTANITEAAAASFDCTKAGTAIEKQICSDPLLSKLDDALGSNYSRMLAANIGDGAKKDLRSKQLDWLKMRNKCQNKNCIVEAYLNRIDGVCDYPVLTGVHPFCISSTEFRETNKDQNKTQDVSHQSKNGDEEKIDKCIEQNFEQEKKNNLTITRAKIDIWRLKCEGDILYAPMPAITVDSKPSKEEPANFEAAFTAWENKKYPTAYKLASELAKKNDPLAQWLMSMMYQFGDGVEKNYAEAFKWAKLSAEQGNAVGQEQLANYYENGIGVVQNNSEALRWYKLSASQGNKEAKNKVQELNNLAAAQVAQNQVSVNENNIWYILSQLNGCSPSPEGPASIIETQKKFDVQVRTFDEVKEGDLIVRVKVKFSNGYINYIRGKARCEAEEKRLDESKNNEIQKYKDRYK